MRDRTLIATGTIGAAFAAICCATPLLAFLLSAAGLTAWLAKADTVLIPLLWASACSRWDSIVDGSV
jgi:mercuric ion transport protein